MTMKRVDGPECPGCGCGASEVLDSRLRFGEQWEKRQCGACGRVFSLTVQDPGDTEDDEGSGWDGHAVDYVVMCCPRCQSNRVRVTRTDKPTRYHKCDDCGQTFKSVEKKATHY